MRLLNAEDFAASHEQWSAPLMMSRRTGKLARLWTLLFVFNFAVYAVMLTMPIPNSSPIRRPRCKSTASPLPSF
jgi:hypothetical protein